MGEIESHRKKYSNYTLYRVSLPAQQSHGAAPVKSQAKDDEEHKSASPICSDAESVMGDDILGEDGDTESLGDKEAPVAPPAIPQAQQEQKSAEAHTSTIPQPPKLPAQAQKPTPTKPVMSYEVYEPKTTEHKPQPPSPVMKYEVVAPTDTNAWTCPGCSAKRTDDFCNFCANGAGGTFAFHSRPAST